MRSFKKQKPITVPQGSSTTIKVLSNRLQRIISNTEYNNMARSEGGPALVTLAQGNGSLRDLSKKSKVSSTYLSLVRSGKVRISTDVYFALLKIAIANEGRS
jgi:hypothetical protein